MKVLAAVGIPTGGIIAADRGADVATMTAVIAVCLAVVAIVAMLLIYRLIMKRGIAPKAKVRRTTVEFERVMRDEPAGSPSPDEH